jgi:hypothetical protein
LGNEGNTIPSLFTTNSKGLRLYNPKTENKIKPKQIKETVTKSQIIPESRILIMINFKKVFLFDFIKM